MNRKGLLTIVFLFFAVIASSQNLQLHYDTRHSLHKEDFKDPNRNYFTATFEMFKPDKWGTNFMFVDFDFSADKGKIGLVYAEIMRDQNLGKLPIKAHIEFNGGLARWGAIDNAYLAGVSYPFQVGKFNFNTYIAYKYNAFKHCSNDVQWTGIWGGSLLDNKITMNGFIDIWTENKNRAVKSDEGKTVVLLIEPQFWYNATPNLSLGTEVEISDNFLPSKKFYVNPTIAAKWNF